MKKFNFAKIALLIFVCVMLFATLAVGAYADEAAETTSVNDVFQFGEYSINENGEASFSFTLNHEAKEALGENVEIGIVIVALDKLNGQSPIGADGKPATLESGKVYVKSLNGYNNTEYSFTLSNFNGELATRKYVVAPYLFDGTTVYYYEGDKVTETVEGISYEEILEITGHEHSYVAGEADENGNVTYACVCGEYYVLNNAAVNGEYYMGTDKVVFADGKLTAMGGEFTYTYNVTTGMIDTDAGIFFQVIDGVIYFRGATPLHQHNEATISTKTTDATCTAKGSIQTICQFCGVIAEEEIPALDHTYVDGYCECGAVDPDYYFEMTIADALVAEDGTKVQVSGTVVKIDYKWSSTNNNMSVTIKDANGDELYIYKLATEVALHDVITVKGIKTTYNGTNGTKIEIDAGATATIDGKEACDFSVEATCEKGVSCSLCGAVQEGSEPLPHNFSEATCEALATCEVCGATTGDFADHVYGDDSVCDNCEFDKKAPIIFEFGETKDESVVHTDGSAWAKTDSFTVGGYKFTLDTFANVYKGAYDEMGNSAIKLGKSDTAGSFSFTVPEEIGKVIIKVAGYKAKTAKVTVNGVNYDIETKSNNGEYTTIEIDTTNEKTVTFAVTSNYRVMIDSIAFVLACKHESTTVVTNDATCTEAGSTTTTCNDCEYVLVEEIKALGHSFGDDGICTRCGHSEAHVHNFVAIEVVAPTCTEKGYTIYTCDCGEDSYNDNYVDALGHKYVDGICSACHAVDPDYYFEMTIPEALAAAAEGTKVIVKGTVCEIYDAWNEGYGNMSAYIADENGNRILVFRTATKMVVGDKISVKGVIGVFNDVNQIAQGSEATITEKHVCSEYTDATCTELAACVVCGATKEDSVLADHNYVSGVCSKCGAQEGVTTITASKTIADLIKEYGWTSSTTKQSFNLDDIVSVKINGGSNTGKAYNGDHIRIYATDSPAGTLTISVAEGYELVSVKITTKTGTYAFLYVDGTTEDICNKSVNVSGSSVLLKSVKNGDNGKQVQITAIEVVYAQSCAHENASTTEPTKATCTEASTQTITCPDCGYEGTVTVQEALGHSYNGEVTTAATCTENGETTYTCANCDHTYTEEIKATGHKFADGKCSVCGEAEGGAPVLQDKTYSYTFTSKQYSANGTKSLGGKNWTFAGTPTGTAYYNYDATKGQQFGSGNNPYKSMTLTSESFSNVKKIVINTSGAKSIAGKLTVFVGGVEVKSISLTATATSYTIEVPEGLSGEIVLSYTQTSSKAIYIKSIQVDYAE